MEKKQIITLLISLLTLLLVACGSPEPAELTQVRLPMGFIADPQYAPFYVAVEKGYFTEEGFEIEFDYSFETDGIALVGANETEFALVSGEQVLLARSEGIPVVYVAEWFQQFPIALVSTKASGIESPADLVGREVGIPGLFGASYVGFAGLINGAGVNTEDVELVEVGFNQVESLLSGQVETITAYVNNEPVQLEGLGEEVTVIPVNDYIDMVANGVITSETYAAENPERVEGFVRAMLRGLEETINNPNEAYEISKGFVEGLDDTRKPVLDASIEVWKADRLGETDAASWVNTQDTLISMGFLEGPLDDLENAYTNEFLP
ncbi:MAG: ABC transporter substrate-binding protein [Chloroflexota bacterium]